MTTNFNPSTEYKLIPLTDWPKRHAWPPLGGLRHLVFNAKKNGFDKVLVRVSGRVLIDETAFFQWCQSKNLQTQGGIHD